MSHPAERIISKRAKRMHIEHVYKSQSLIAIPATTIHERVNAHKASNPILDTRANYCEDSSLSCLPCVVTIPLGSYLFFQHSLLKLDVDPRSMKRAAGVENHKTRIPIKKKSAKWLLSVPGCNSYYYKGSKR